MPTVNYVWNPAYDSYLMELDADGLTSAAYTSEPVPHGRLVSQRRNGLNYFVHSDAQCNVRTLTDSQQNPVEMSAYSAFGEPVQHTTSISNPFGFRGSLGYYTNGFTGECYARWRHYSPGIARWTSLDPIGFTDDPNRYKYCRNSPTMYVDPSGLACRSCGSTLNLRGTKISDLDSIGRQGTPFTDAMDAIVANERDKYREVSDVTLARIPTITHTGPGIVHNRPNVRLPIRGAYAIAYWAFFVWFYVCEDEPGDCEMAVFETWKEEEHAIPDPENAGWREVTSAELKVRHSAIPRIAPLVYPPGGANVLITESARNVCKCCDPADAKVVIHADFANLDAHLAKFGELFRRSFGRRNTVDQENILYQKGDDNPVAVMNHTFTLGVDVNGGLIASP